MKTFEAKFKESSDGVFAISLVTSPATQENFIALSEQKDIVQLTEVDKEQRILMGLVLQPDQLIYRKQDDVEFNIVFSADTIKELSHNFFKSGFQLNSKLEHQEQIEGVTFVESWLVENSDIDKSANFGMKYPKGTWMATMKVDNDDIWNDYIKTGKLKGFSVDAMVDLQEVNFKSNINMSTEKKTLLEKMEVWFTETIVNKPAVEVAPTEVVEEIVVAPTEVVEVVTEKVAMASDEVTKTLEMLITKQNESFTTELSAVKTAYDVELTALKAELVELKGQPAAKPIVAKPSQVELSKSGKLLEKLRNNK